MQEEIEMLRLEVEKLPRNTQDFFPIIMGKEPFCEMGLELERALLGMTITAVAILRARANREEV